MKARNKTRLSIVAALAVMVGLLEGCFLLVGDFGECQPGSGVCSPPKPGLLVDKVGLTKSLWFEEESVGDPRASAPTICRADLDVSPGTEIVFRGWDGLAVLGRRRRNPPRREWQTNSGVSYSSSGSDRIIVWHQFLTGGHHARK